MKAGIVLKKSIAALLLAGICLFAAGCDEQQNTIQEPGNSVSLNNSYLSEPVSNEELTESDENETEDRSATEESTEAAKKIPQAPEAQRNRYTASGQPELIYEVIGNSYSGNYKRYIYDNGVLSNIEIRFEDPSGTDTLLSSSVHTYDGRGRLSQVTEWIPDKNDELYVANITRYRNDSDGKLLEQTDIAYNESGAELYNQRTEHEYGQQRLLLKTTISNNDVLTEKTEYTYTFFDNGKVQTRTETTVIEPGSASEITVTKIYTLDSAGRTVRYEERDQYIASVITYEYDAQGRELSSRMYDGNDVLTETSMTDYETYSDGSKKVTQKLFSADGKLIDTAISYFDARGERFIPA